MRFALQKRTKAFYTSAQNARIAANREYTAISEKPGKNAPVFTQNSGKSGSEGIIRGHNESGFTRQIHGLSGQIRFQIPVQAFQKRYPRQARYSPGLPIGRSRFPVPREIVSTPKEKLAIFDYFLNPVKKKAIRSCKIAALYEVRILKRVVIRDRSKKGRCDPNVTNNRSHKTGRWG